MYSKVSLGTFFQLKTCVMKTEIPGDFKGYFLRCKFPTKRCFSMPLKSVGLIFGVECLLASLLMLIGIQAWGVVFMLVSCMMAIGYYIGVLYKDFWNIVLDESKGLFPDMVMWVYYMVLFAISLSPAFVIFYLFGL